MRQFWNKDNSIKASVWQNLKVEIQLEKKNSLLFHLHPFARASDRDFIQDIREQKHTLSRKALSADCYKIYACDIYLYIPPHSEKLKRI